MTASAVDGQVAAAAAGVPQVSSSPAPASPAGGRRRGQALPRALVMLLGAGAAVLVPSGSAPPPGWSVPLLLVAGLLVVFALVVVVSLARLADLVPQYAARADDLLRSPAGSLTRFGVQPDQLEQAVSEVNPEKVVTLVELRPLPDPAPLRG